MGILGRLSRLGRARETGQVGVDLPEPPLGIREGPHPALEGDGHALALFAEPFGFGLEVRDVALRLVTLQCVTEHGLDHVRPGQPIGHRRVGRRVHGLVGDLHRAPSPAAVGGPVALGVDVHRALAVGAADEAAEQPRPDAARRRRARSGDGVGRLPLRARHQRGLEDHLLLSLGCHPARGVEAAEARVERLAQDLLHQRAGEPELAGERREVPGAAEHGREDGSDLLGLGGRVAPGAGGTVEAHAEGQASVAGDVAAAAAVLRLRPHRALADPRALEVRELGLEHREQSIAREVPRPVRGVEHAARAPELLEDRVVPEALGPHEPVSSGHDHAGDIGRFEAGEQRAEALILEHLRPRDAGKLHPLDDGEALALGDPLALAPLGGEACAVLSGLRFGRDAHQRDRVPHRPPRAQSRCGGNAAPPLRRPSVAHGGHGRAHRRPRGQSREQLRRAGGWRSRRQLATPLLPASHCHRGSTRASSPPRRA